MTTKRTDPPKAGAELTTLSGFLDFLREAIVIKATGLDDEALRRQLLPSGACLLGIVKHLAYVERWWSSSAGGLRIYSADGMSSFPGPTKVPTQTGGSGRMTRRQQCLSYT
jgi:hypothetical protein